MNEYRPTIIDDFEHLSARALTLAGRPSLPFRVRAKLLNLSAQLLLLTTQVSSRRYSTAHASRERDA